MDAISVAASIVGLLGAAAKVSDVLFKFIGNVKEAPKLAQSVLMEVSDVSACLKQLQIYVQGRLSRSSTQEELLMAEQLVVALSNCVLVFSELEETVESLKPAEPMQPWRMAQWIFKEQAISALMVRMQQSKLSLSLMLSVLTCTSIGEAQSSASQLRTLVQEVLDSNHEMSRRMVNLEMRTLGYSQGSVPTSTTLKTSWDDSNINIMRATAESNKGRVPPGERIETVRGASEISGGDLEALEAPTFTFTFDQGLRNSRPYTRAMKRSSMWSTTSSAVHTMNWSCLSGLSLAEVSEISVIDLPISAEELWNGHHYIHAVPHLAHTFEIDELSIMDDVINGDMYSSYKTKKRPIKGRERIISRKSERSSGGSLNFDTNQPLREFPSMVDGRWPRDKRIITIGASMAGKIAIYHRMGTLEDEMSTKPERQRARDLVKHALVNGFQEAKRQYRFSMPVEDIEHFDDLAYAIDVELGERIIPGKRLIKNSHKMRTDRDMIVSLRGRSFHVYDLGGRISEREDWVNYFQDVYSIMFVVPLTSYCQTLPEDTKENRMQESLILFESVSKLGGLRAVPMIVLFNNYDLLEQRMQDHPIKDYFPAYSGDSNLSIACRFFAGQFAEHDRDGRLTILVTNKAEQNDGDFYSMIDKLCPDLFPEVLTTIAEVPE